MPSELRRFYKLKLERKARVIIGWLGDACADLAMDNPQDEELSLMAQCVLLDRNLDISLKSICLCTFEAQPGRSHECGGANASLCR